MGNCTKKRQHRLLFKCPKKWRHERCCRLRRLEKKKQSKEEKVDKLYQLLNLISTLVVKITFSLRLLFPVIKNGEFSPLLRLFKSADFPLLLLLRV